MSFDYKLEADPAQAVAASRTVEESLTGVERHAKAVGQAMSDGFNKGAVAASSATERIEAMGVNLDDFAAASRRIHAPLDTLEKDMRILGALQAEGAISAAQYATELERIGKAHGLTGANPADAVSLPGLPALDKGKTGDVIEGIGGKLMGIVGPAALAATALQAITEEFDNWKARTADTRDATNEILKFHDSIETASAAMAEQRQLSEDLNLNIKKTAHAYADVREATEELGLSSKQMADITRNLTAALIVDGGSIEGVSAIMGKLQYANEQGFLSARELKGIWQQSPEVIHSFEASLNKTYPELQKMANEGRLTGAVLEKMTLGLGEGHEAIDKYKQRLQSISSVMEEQHVNWYEAVRLIGEAKKAYAEVGETGPEMMERIGKATQHTFDVTEKLVEKLQLIMTAATVQGRFASDKTLIDNGLKVGALLLSQQDDWTQYRARIADARTEMERAGLSGKALADALAQIHPPGWVDYYAEELKKIREPQTQFDGRLAAINALLARGKINTAEYTAELEKLTKQYNQFDPAAARGAYFAEKYKGNQTDLTNPDAQSDYLHPASEGWQDIDLMKIKANKQDPNAEMLSNIEKAKTATDELKKSMDAFVEAEKQRVGSLGKVIQDELVGGVGDLSTAIVDAGRGADVSWSNVFDNLARGIEKAIVQALILKALTGSWTGAAGAGGAYGGLFGLIADGGSHATGGGYTARGTGGSDSIPVLFNMSPNESAYFVPAGQSSPWSAMGGGGGASNQNVRINLTTVQEGMEDEDILAAVDSDGGDRVAYNREQRNRRRASRRLAAR